MSKSLFFLIVLLVLSFVFAQLYVTQLMGYQTVALTERFSLSNHVLSDFLSAIGLIILLVQGNLFLRLSGYLLFIVLILIYSLQYAALYLTGDYVSPVALDNIQHIGLIISPSILAIASGIILTLVVIVITAEIKLKKPARSNMFLIIVLCFLLATFLKLDRYWLSQGALDTRAELYQSSNNPVEYMSPLAALIKTYNKTQQHNHKIKSLSATELQTAAKYGISYNQLSDYPLIKNQMYSSELPFKLKDDFVPEDKPLNIIVFFSEGISARIIQPYNYQYQNLTPNIADFAKSAMRVDNYYNHTFATYRGLLGQLCSIFPTYGGGKVNLQTDYFCLGNLFNQNNYTTHFLFSQQKNKTNLESIFAKANIQHILAEDELSQRYLKQETKKRLLALSDQQFFKASIEYMRGIEQQQQSADSTAFFMGLYNIETHAFYQMSDDGNKYREKDNYILDTIHNYDDAFGKFWSYFKNSRLYDNTIVILTSDHAHFQGTDFVSLVNNQSSYKPYFVDKIPLLIYHPKLDLPESFDAKYASSLDLAPSIAHLMKFQNQKHSFLGSSIFELVGKNGVAFGDGYLYSMGKDSISVQNQYNENADDDNELNQMYKIITNIQSLEIQGRVWNRDFDQ